jgi:hypothetical protein
LTERVDIHVDLGNYLLGRLDERERALVEEHLGSCERCRAAAALEATAALLARAAAPVAPPADLEQRALSAVRDLAEGNPPARLEGAGARPGVRLPRWSWPRRLAVAGAATAALAVGVFGGMLLARDPGLPGTPELETALRSPSGAAASASVRMTGVGRVIEFHSDNLPILPEGEYYELWFVGKGDRRRAPNRISAGTFHPDQNGRSNVRFAAAVDPADYPRLAVTAEPGDGDPRQSGRTVLVSPVQP